MSNEVMFGNQSSAEYADTDLFQSQRGSTSRMERKDHALNPSFVLTPDKTNLFVRIGGLAVLFSSSPHGPSIPAFGAATSLRWSGMDLGALQ